MARYKVITYKDEQYKLLNKRHRIHHIVDAVYVLLIVLGIVICGINQNNNLIVGWGLILMGAVSIPVTVFHTYMYKNKWRPALWWDEPNHRQYVNQKEKEDDLSAVKFWLIVETVFLFLFSTGLPVAGILKLFEII